MQTRIGKVISASERFYFFETDDGELLSIVWEGEDPLPPLETYIALSLPDEPWQDGRYVVDNTGKYWTYAAPHTQDVEVWAAAPLNGPEPKKIALYWQHRPGADTQQELKTATKQAFEIQRFYNKYARDKWAVECKAFLFSDYQGRPEPPYYGLREILAEVDLGDFSPDINHVRSHWYHSSYCGLGNVYGDKSATYDGSGNCGLHTYLHEIGHNFGLHHANMEGKEYYDKSCIMGMGPAINGINAYHIQKLKLYDERERINVNDSTMLLVAPVELPWHSLHDGEYQHVNVYRDGKDTVYLSLRKKKGWPWTPREQEHELFVHVRTEDNKSDLIDTVWAGKSFTLPNGVQVNYKEYKRECALIELIYPNSSSTPAQLTIPAGLPKRLGGSEPKDSSTGLWRDKRYSGQGLDLQVKNGRIIGYLYSFNQWTGKYSQSEQRWYMLDGKVGDNEIKVYTTVGGTFDNPTTAVLKEIGVAQISVTSDDTATLLFDTDEHGRGCMYLSKIDHSKDSGLFYDKAFTKSGFSVQFPAGQSSPEVVMYWYTYDNLKNQRWYYLAGEGGSLTIYEATGGFWCDYQKAEVTKIGVAEWEANQFAYHFDDGRSGVFNLTELF